MTRVLGHEMMSRGTDATGVLTVDFKGRWRVRKKDLPASVFIAGRAGLGKRAQTALIHTRAATQGRPEDNNNNHPIIHGSIVGIHNGIVYNDDDLFGHFKWPRLARVDSEAIFAALNYLPQEEALLQIDAGWAIGWIDTSDDPRKMWLARGSSSPLCYSQTQAGSVIFASTRQAVIDAMKAGGIVGVPNVEYAPEGFLAHTNPDDGGLTILPTFDGSGTGAIGARRTRSVGVWKGHNYGQWDDDKEAWEVAHLLGTASKKIENPAPWERVMISGDAANPKVGDRRKYRTGSGTWLYEICTKVEDGLVTWNALYNANTDHESTMHGPVEPPDEPVQGELVIDDDDPYDFDDEFAYGGDAHIGSWIAIPKDLFDGGEGSLIGEVIGMDPISGDLFVDFRGTRIDHGAFYQVLNDTKETADA